MKAAVAPGCPATAEVHDADAVRHVDERLGPSVPERPSCPERPAGHRWEAAAGP
jgi:hypothetical protein